MNKFLDRIGIDSYSFLKIIKFLFITFILVNISSYLMYLFGSSYFALHCQDNDILNFLISVIFMYLNTIMLVGFIFKIYDKSIFTLGLLYYIIYLLIFGISALLFPSIKNYISFIVPFVYIIIHRVLFEGSTFKYIRRFIVYSVIIIFFQLLEISYREMFCGFVNYDMSTNYINKIIINCNNLILQFLIYTIFYIKDVNNYGFKLLLFTNTKSNVNVIQKQNEIDYETLEEIENMSKKDKFLFLSFVAVVQLLQFFIVALVCILGNGTSGFYELILTLIGFWSTRSILGKSFHFDDLAHCTIFSAIIFLIATKLTPSINLSAFMPTIIGSLLAFLLYHLKLHFDKYNELKDKVGDSE